jgi:hypothetical protein
MNEEEVEDFTGLESSMTRTGGAEEAGVDGHSAPQAGSGEDPAAASTPAQVERKRWGFWVLGVSFCDTEGQLLHRFRRPGLRKQTPMMLILIF